MDFIPALTSFTNGGKNEVLIILIPAGLMALSMGLLSLVLYKGGFYAGLGTTLILIALLFMIYGTGFAYKKYEKKYETVSQNYAADSKATIDSEIERMKEYNTYTKNNFYTALIIIVVSLIVIFTLDIRWLTGVATALLFFSFVSLTIENGFSKIRSAEYVKTLNSLATETIKND